MTIPRKAGPELSRRRAFSDNDRGPADRGDRHLAQEPELTVPRNRGRGENGRSAT
jgi:hypothetical protein